MQQTDIDWASASPVWTNGPAMNFHTPDEPQGAVDIAGLFAVLRRRFYWIVIAVAISVALAMAFLATAPKTFTSSADLFLDPKGLRIVKDDITGRGSGSSTDLIELQSQQLVITSSRVLGIVVDGENLADDPEFGSPRNSGIKGLIKTFLGMRPPPGDRRKTAIENLADSVSVNRANESYIVSIFVTTLDAQKSANLANAMAEAYLMSEMDVRADIAKRASASLFERVEQLREDVRVAEERLEAFKAEHNIVGASGTLVSEQQLSGLSANLIAARAATAEAKARYDQIKKLSSGGTSAGAITEAVQSGTISSLRTQAAEVARQEAELAIKYGAQHPYVREVRAQRENFDRLIRDELTRIVGAAQNDYLRAKAKEESLSASLDRLTENTLETNQALVKLRELQRDATSKREVYRDYLSRARQIDEQQSVNTMNARIISPAQPSGRDDGPSKMMTLAAALVMGLGLGTGAIWLREQFQQASTESEQDLIALIQRPLLGVVPAKGAGSTISTKSSALSGIFAKKKTPGTAVGAPQSPVREAYFQLADRLDMTLSDQRPRTVLFLSPQKCDAKAAAVVELSRAMVDIGAEVLVIDGDPRERGLTREIGIERDAGFLDVVRGQCKLVDALWVDETSDLVVLPMARAGTTKPPQKPLRREITPKAMQFEQMPELMLIDAEPPTNATLLSTFLGRADDIVLVLEQGVTTKTALKEALLALGIHRANIRGAVIITS